MELMTQEERVQYNRRINNWKATVRSIKLGRDITSTQGKQILSQLDELYGDIRLEYGDILKNFKEAEQLIDRIRYKGQTGNNTELRKANGIKAVENVELGDGTIINLYEVYNELMCQKEDLEAILDVIEKKQSMVITMSGLLKIESNISGH